MVLNPVTIFHLIGGAHNDALMLGLLVAGLTAGQGEAARSGASCSAPWPPRSRRRRRSASSTSAGAGWAPGSRSGTGSDRWSPPASSGSASSGSSPTSAASGWGWVDHPRARRAWSGRGPRRPPGSPSPSPASPTSPTSGSGSGACSRSPGSSAWSISAVCGVWLLLNSDRIGTLKALGLTLLIFVLLGPVVQPWYLSWGLILLAPVALGQLRSLIIGLSMVTAFIELPGRHPAGHDPAPRRPAADRADAAVDPGRA